MCLLLGPPGFYFSFILNFSLSSQKKNQENNSPQKKTGSGKTTLMKLLANEIPYGRARGDIFFNKKPICPETHHRFFFFF